MGKPGKSIEVIPGVTVKNQKELVELLKNHPLLQHCTSEKLGSENTGQLVWARNPGSVFWPAIIAAFEDKPGTVPSEEEDLSSNEYGCVMFLETTFRYALLHWNNIILAAENQIEIQETLVTKLNRCVIKKNFRPEKAYKEAVALLNQFIPMDVSKRQDHISNLSLERKAIKALKSGVVQTSTATPSTSRLSISSTPPISEISIETERPRNTEKYSLRQSVPKPRTSQVTSSNASTISSRCPTPSDSTTGSSGNEEGGDTLSDISRKARRRPKVGGAEMKQFAEDRFLSTDKGFKLDGKNKNDVYNCAECFKEIVAGQDVRVTCHDMPHHETCLQLVSVKQKDGSLQVSRKCRCCAETLCFICKSKEKGDELPTKCSKCDLHFHRSCLESWPQAQVQGSTGPITCPVHFCHTCLGEQKVYNRMRNIKVQASSRYRCLHCLATYHKPSCLPAGCIETISGNNFLICPKHTLPNVKITQRRFGCLSCGILIKPKGLKVECTLCLQLFHPECVGYSETEEESGMPLEVFARDYKCVSCLWGLYPLYGQVIWYQQSQHSFWPARILFPREAVGRTEYAANTRAIGEYSIRYFGPLPSYFDKASRTLPLHLTTVKIFTAMKIYQETNQIKSSYEEASFFHSLVEELRDTRLPHPEPHYKRVEKNIYRTTVIKRKQEATGACLCWERDGDDICSQNSECHNRDTAIECNEKNCKAGSRCQNRMFSVRQKDAETTCEQFLTTTKGWAVKAAQDFKEGDFVIEYRGEIINNREMQYRANKKSEEDPLYLLEIDKNTFIDAEFCGNISRLINHSCEPNCRTEKYTSDGRPVVGVFAQQNIKKGEELTFDYAYGSESAAPFRCHCGAESCRGFIGKKDDEDEPAVDTVNLELDKYDKQCSKCSYGGYVLCCDFEGCFKVYHKSCAQLTQEPKGEWYCPDHKVTPSKAALKRKSMKKSTGEPAVKKEKGSTTTEISSKLLNGAKRRLSLKTEVVTTVKRKAVVVNSLKRKTLGMLCNSVILG